MGVVMLVIPVDGVEYYCYANVDYRPASLKNSYSMELLSYKSGMLRFTQS